MTKHRQKVHLTVFVITSPSDRRSSDDFEGSRCDKSLDWYRK